MYYKELSFSETRTIIEQDRSLIFVHIHKTGGKTLRDMMSYSLTPGQMDGLVEDACVADVLDHSPKFLKMVEERFPHLKTRIDEKVRVNSFRNHDWYSPAPKKLDTRGRLVKDHSTVFSIIRNPYDWMVSMWEHGDYGQAGVKDFYGSFKEYVMEFNSPRTRMDYWNQPWRLNDQGQVKQTDTNRGIRKGNTVRWPLRYLQTWQTFAYFNKPGSKKCNANFYLRLEKFDEFSQEVWNTNPVNVYASKRRRGRDYREYYDDEMIDRIEKHRRQELDLLGYSFDGPIDDAPAIQVTSPYRLSADILK